MIKEEGTASQALAGCQILIVEDEYFVADDLARAFRRLGADVLGPTNGVAQAASILEEEPVSAAVLDINLRGKPVYQVAERLRSRGIPFVFATGYDAIAVSSDFRNVVRWEKPFDAAALARSFLDLLKGRPCASS